MSLLTSANVEYLVMLPFLCGILDHLIMLYITYHHKCSHIFHFQFSILFILLRKHYVPTMLFLGILGIMSHCDLHRSTFMEVFFFIDSIAKRIGFND